MNSSLPLSPCVRDAWGRDKSERLEINAASSGFHGKESSHANTSLRDHRLRCLLRPRLARPAFKTSVAVSHSVQTAKHAKDTRETRHVGAAAGIEKRGPNA